MALFIITARPGVRHYAADGSWTFEGVAGTDGGKPVDQMTFRKEVEITHKQDAVRAFYDYAAELDWLVTEGWGGLELTAGLRKGDKAPKGFRQVVWDHYVPPYIPPKYSEDSAEQEALVAVAKESAERVKESSASLKDFGNSVAKFAGLGFSAFGERAHRDTAELHVWSVIGSWVESGSHTSIDAIERDIRDTIAAGERSQGDKWKSPFEKANDAYMIEAWKGALNFMAWVRPETAEAA